MLEVILDTGNLLDFHFLLLLLGNLLLLFNIIHWDLLYQAVQKCQWFIYHKIIIIFQLGVKMQMVALCKTYQL